MPSNYCVRLYKYSPQTTTPDAGTLTPTVYGPQAALAGWAANFSTADAFAEVLVSMSDPNGQNQISNISAIDFRTGLPTEGDRDVTYAGICDASAQGAQFAGQRVQAIPVSVVALPGGRKRVVGAGRYSVAPGALVFQL